MEEEREHLYILIERYGTDDPEVIKCSQKLDDLIMNFYKQLKNTNQN